MRNQTDDNKGQEFLDYYAERLVSFIQSDEEMIHLEPMNSFYRRLIHNLAIRFKLKTHSEGENRERHIVITKAGDSSIPKDLNLRTPVWDWGDREFLVNSLEEEVEIVLNRDGSFGLKNLIKKRSCWMLKKLPQVRLRLKTIKLSQFMILIGKSYPAIVF